MPLHLIIGWVVLIEKSKGLKCSWNEIKNGFEIKEKKIRKIKEFKKLFSENLPKIGSFMFELKSVFWIVFILDLVRIWNGFELRKEKGFRKK